MENEITKVEPNQMQLAIPADAPMMTRLAMMIEGGVKIDVEQMSKMQEMAERFEANEARKSFSADFTIAQSNIGAVVKTKYNPQTKSNYAGLDGVIEMVKPVYTAQGFSVIFYEGETAVVDNIRVCADVLHRDGHKETYHYDVPLGGKGIAGKVNMIDIHAKATSVTYGERYLLSMIWNIPTQDKDGNPPQAPPPPQVQPVTSEEKGIIKAIIEKLQPKEGFDFNVGRITALCIEKHRQDLNVESVIRMSEWLMKHTDADLYVEIQTEQTFIENEIPGEFGE